MANVHIKESIMIVYLKINGVAMPTPRAYSIQRSDLDSQNTTRSEAGYLQRDRVRANTYKVVYDWRVQERDLQKLNSALSSEEFTAEIYDGTTGAYLTIARAYASADRTSTLVLPNENDPSQNWWDFKCDIIEY